MLVEEKKWLRKEVSELQRKLDLELKVAPPPNFLLVTNPANVNVGLLREAQPHSYRTTIQLPGLWRTAGC